MPQIRGDVLNDRYAGLNYKVMIFTAYIVVRCCYDLFGQLAAPSRVAPGFFKEVAYSLIHRVCFIVVARSTAFTCYLETKAALAYSTVKSSSNRDKINHCVLFSPLDSI